MNVSMQIQNNSFKSTEISKVEAEKNKAVENKKVRSIGGSVGALAVAGIVKNGFSSPIQNFLMDKFTKLGTFNVDEGKIVHDAVKEMYAQAGLKEKGVRIKFLNKKLKEKKSFLFDAKTKKISDTFMKDLNDLLAIDTVRSGKNAFYVFKDLKLPKITYLEYQEIVKKEGKEIARQKLKEKAIYIKGNSVVLSKEGLHSAGFHELGHAMNRNLSKFGKFLQSSRPVSMYLPVLLALYGACTRKAKPKDEESKLNGAQKTHNFVRNNAGKLAFLASVPMLLEEGMATVKGQKFANKLLKPDLAKKVSKANIWAYMTYVTVALFGAFAATTAVKLKDRAIDKKEAKLAAEAAATEVTKDV